MTRAFSLEPKSLPMWWHKVAMAGSAIMSLLLGCTTSSVDPMAVGGGGSSVGGGGAAGGGDCAPLGESVCPCEPYDVDGPPEVDAGSPTVEWTSSVGGVDDDGAGIVPLDGGVVVLTAHSGGTALERHDANGALAWRTELPMRSPQVATTESGEIFLVFELGDDSLTVGDVTLTNAPGKAFIVEVGATSGSLGAVVELPPADGELWSGFVADASGFHVFRASGEVSHVYRYAVDGSEVWRKDHELSTYAATQHPDGGVVLAGGDGDAIVVRLLDEDRDETWSLPVTGPVAHFVHETIAVSPTGRVALGVRISRSDPELELVHEARLVAFDPTGAVELEASPPVALEGLAFMSETELAIWRTAGGEETPGWYLEGMALVGGATFQWSLPARDDYFQLGRAGHLVARGGYLFASGAFLAGLNLAPGVTVSSAGCTDHFVARFGTP